MESLRVSSIFHTTNFASVPSTCKETISNKALIIPSTVFSFQNQHTPSSYSSNFLSHSLFFQAERVTFVLTHGYKLKTGAVMENIKKIPYGISNFVEVVEQNQYYVDKTAYLPLLEEQPSNLFFIRPRRFGKSIFLSMLRAYYDINQKGAFQKRFGNLWIG